MMKTYNRVCLIDCYLEDAGKEMRLERGKEYTTSEVKNDKIMVFSKYWVWCPVEWFAGEKRFT